jgi:outer membrane protein OmpA-like peptidoglycan-associated protein
MRSNHWIRTSFAALAFATASAAAAQSDLANVTDFTTVDRYAIDADSIEAALSADRSTNFRVAPPTALLPIEFEFDSCEPTPPSRHALRELGKALRSRGLTGQAFRIEGHTDSMGTDAYNQDLSQRRAGVVRRYLEGQGVASSRLASLGLGESRPRQSNETEAGRQRNRRVEVVNRGWVSAD